MKSQLIFVTGYFGAPITEEAKKLADDKKYRYISLDEEIEKKDGRNVKRLCMMMGEHGYRNEEYEALERISAEYDINPEGVVVACGDGVLHDDMSRAIILKHQLVIAGKDMSIDQLWENARTMDDTYHAFMFFGDDNKKRADFEAHYDRQTALFSKGVQDDLR